MNGNSTEKFDVIVEIHVMAIFSALQTLDICYLPVPFHCVLNTEAEEQGSNSAHRVESVPATAVPGPATPVSTNLNGSRWDSDIYLPVLVDALQQRLSSYPAKSPRSPSQYL